MVFLDTDAMFARGLKRKCADSEDSPPAPPACSLQRQSLLDMSLVKLQLCHMLAEPNLCRSVLIANTVRQLQEEMSQDSAWQVPAPASAGRGPLERLVSTEILCRTPWEQQGGHSAADSGGSPAPDLLSEPPGAPSAQAPRGAPGCAWEAASPRESRGGFQRSLDQIFETLDSKAPRAAEGLFADVDGPYYDLDAVLTGMVGAKSVPGDGFETLAPTGAPPPGVSYKRDLGELDHVVEILVET
ncbi:cell division cycle-associated protein 4 isoform X3 [Myotis myotis]|uniref:cell division cycle-associated protein 4 isoform X3 n=1 Tax=Myotis myotis TaxID=51298 RepID=UPI00174A3D88|nr:cell division cycle-associated protein 4 isoform X3 [Myotis myotis]